MAHILFLLDDAGLGLGKAQGSGLRGNDGSWQILTQTPLKMWASQSPKRVINQPDSEGQTLSGQSLSGKAKQSKAKQLIQWGPQSIEFFLNLGMVQWFSQAETDLSGCLPGLFSLCASYADW